MSGYGGDPRYAGYQRQPQPWGMYAGAVASPIRGLLETFAPGASDFAAARDSVAYGGQMAGAMRRGDWGAAVGPGLLSLAAGLGALPMVPSVVGATTVLGKKAIDHFGVTPNPREAGYILDEGELLDLSGRHYSGDYTRVGDKFVAKPGQRDWLAETRNVDHRELEGLVDVGGTDGMRRFMAEANAVRMSPESGGYHVATMPTDQQINRMISSWRRLRTGDPMYVDVFLPGDTYQVESLSFKRPDAESVKSAISGLLGR